MYHKKAHIHFVGIGGIGMSGIATILRLQGYQISGCDIDTHQKSIIDLKAIGCTIGEGNNSAQCDDHSIDILVYSSAIKITDEEIQRAQQRGIPTISRALMLAELMRTKYSIAVAGMHGKTTTTSLISHILIEAHKDPTVIIGGHLKNISSNARMGTGDFLVAEADESDRSLLSLQATLAIITNINLEHLDTYTDIEDIKQTFVQFLNNLPFYGKAIVCIDDPYIRSILPMPHIKFIKYGINPDADLYADAIELGTDHVQFTVCTATERLGRIMLPMPGIHNVRNCLAAIALCRDLTISFETITQACATFKGVDRRFSYRGIFNGAEIFDDYGHHPDEIKHTVAVARQRSKGKLILVFQPHRYTRTDKLWHYFIDTFKQLPIDELLITDIHAASEEPIPGITSDRFVAALQTAALPYTVRYVPYEKDFKEMQRHLTTLANSNDLILLQGAGKITLLSRYLCNDNL
ncbi:MAG: UDP-N-acetylmuramate--L-alanine ligase [Candidatus Babeliales bacterium]